MSGPLHPRPSFAVALLISFGVALAGCVVETREPVFSRNDIVRVDVEKAEKMGFAPVMGRNTYFYRVVPEGTCEVGFVPLDGEGRFYIAATFSHPCLKATEGYFYVLADFGTQRLKFLSVAVDHRRLVRELAADAGIPLLYEKEYRYVAVEDVSGEQIKAFFRSVVDNIELTVSVAD